MKAEDSGTEISVIIPTKNEGDAILECLSSIYNQSLQPFEVIIVDGGSTDNTLKEARQFPVKVITETKPSSLPNARNVGVKNAKGDIILIIDADVILEKNCLSNAVKYFVDPTVIAVVPSENKIAHSRLEKIQMDWDHGSANSFKPGIGIPAFAEFFRKTAFEKIEFDPRLGYGEDQDFQQRFRKLYGKSAKIMYASDSRLSAHYSHTLKELKTQYTWYGRTFRRYLQKSFSLSLLMNLGSLLAPVFLLVLLFLSLFITLLLPLIVLVAALLVARNLLVCYRSKSFHFIEFVGYEFARSIFFTFGVIHGFFSRKRGK